MSQVMFHLCKLERTTLLVCCSRHYHFLKQEEVFIVTCNKSTCNSWCDILQNNYYSFFECPLSHIQQPAQVPAVQNLFNQTTVSAVNWQELTAFHCCVQLYSEYSPSVQWVTINKHYATSFLLWWWQICINYFEVISCCWTWLGRHSFGSPPSDQSHVDILDWDSQRHQSKK